MANPRKVLFGIMDLQRTHLFPTQIKGQTDEFSRCLLLLVCLIFMNTLSVRVESLE